MILTTAQLQAVKAWVIANQSSIFGQAAVDALNALASPAFIVWRTSVPMSEIMLNGFNWTRVDNLSIGKARIWDWMKDAGVGQTIDPSKPNIRAGIDAVWVGTQADLDVRAAVYVHCKRSATVCEKLLATGTGSDAVPATMGAEGSITLDQVIASEST